MPLVHIHLVEGQRSQARVRELADTVQDVMLAFFRAPPLDRYQLISEHKMGHIIAEDTGLGFARTPEIVVVQIFQQGRTTDDKRAAYRELAAALDAKGLVAPNDLIVSVVENTKADWSFGGGVGQFVDGPLGE